MISISLDPNYDHTNLYRSVKFLCLLYDSVYAWYPSVPLMGSACSAKDMAALIEAGIVKPVGDSRWWERNARTRLWSGAAGEWHSLDALIAKKRLYVSFAQLVGDEDEFRRRIEALAKEDAADAEYSGMVQGLGLLPYGVVMRQRAAPEWFAACFRSHREVAAALQCSELVADNHREPWKYLFRRVAASGVVTMRAKARDRGLASLLSSTENVDAIGEFLDDIELILPEKLTASEIMRFRESGASKSFRLFLESVHRNAQQGQGVVVERSLIDEFNELAKSYRRGRQLFSFAASTLIVGPGLWLAHMLSPEAMGVAGFLARSGFATARQAASTLYDKVNGVRSGYSWVLHLARPKARRSDRL
ncbi:MAG TPA: hypothetical protein VJV79_30760 [Polyangiaceae bacterium]|nr:hypothetical protein [Polyangiaceae bacterium]